jgi:transcriptional regulator with XRE-family HTH domain
MMALSKGFDGEAYYSALARTVEARALNWKQVSKSTGVSASTLTRMAQGKRPDAASLAALSAWSGLNPAQFVEGVEVPPKKQDLVTEFSALLRAQKDLSNEARGALESLVKAAYTQLKATKKE